MRWMVRFVLAVALDELRVAEYGGEYVVEVVSDARGELAERAQLVRLSGALARELALR
jgi:hypothetical protein